MLLKTGVMAADISALTSQEHYILKYIKIENSSFNITLFHNII